MKEFYDKYKVYLTRTNLELVAVTIIAICAIVVFTSGIPAKGSLTLDSGAIKYDGSLVRGKINGKGKVTFDNGDVYEGQLKNGTFDGKGIFTSSAGWKYEGQFVKGQAEGQGTLTTEANVVYKGKFKQGIYQNEN